MPVFSFKTIRSPSEGLFKNRGSKFLAFAYPVESELDIKERLTLLRKEYFDARHHCFGWMLGPERKLFRAFDDGEPNHSAGDPILGQIRSRELTNVLVVVVRYFGGVKLGVGGLISAYKAAADDALAKSNTIEKEVRDSMTLTFDYTATPEIMRLVKEFSLSIKEQSFEDRCEMKTEFNLRIGNDLEEKIKLLSLTGTRVEIKQTKN
jgi:uncharacterized YigZ family protein